MIKYTIVLICGIFFAASVLAAQHTSIKQKNTDASLTGRMQHALDTNQYKTGTNQMILFSSSDPAEYKFVVNAIQYEQLRRTNQLIARVAHNQREIISLLEQMKTPRKHP